MDKKTNIHICCLKGEAYLKKKRNSHIIPKMFFDEYKKAHKNSSFIRGLDNEINQQGPKEFMLCDSCERLFSKYETHFAKLIKNPVYHHNPLCLKIDDGVRFCVLSILWRILRKWVVDSNESQWTFEYSELEKIEELEKNWHSILRDENFARIKGLNILIIPVDWCDSSNKAISFWKEYPGFVGDISYNPLYGICAYCLVEKMFIIGYSTNWPFVPKNCSLKSDSIIKQQTFLPFSLENRLLEYKQRLEELLK